MGDGEDEIEKEHGAQDRHVVFEGAAGKEICKAEVVADAHVKSVYVNEASASMQENIVEDRAKEQALVDRNEVVLNNCNLMSTDGELQKRNSSTNNDGEEGDLELDASFDERNGKDSLEVPNLCEDFAEKGKSNSESEEEIPLKLEI